MKRYLFPLIFILLIAFGYSQDLLYSPLTPKAAAIAHFKLDMKALSKKNQTVATSSNLLTEDEIKAKHGRLELVRLLDNSFLRGVVIEQGEDFIRVETSSGIKKIMTENVDTVEIIR